MNKVPTKRETKTAAPRGADHPFYRFRERMNDLFDDFFDFSRGERDWLSPLEKFEWPGGKVVPQVDVSENKKAYTISAELPGLEEDDIDVSIKDGILTIKGEKREEDKEEKGNYYRSERHYGMFQRSFRLPNDVDEDKIKADLKKGVLTLKLPKSAGTVTNRKKISIASATSSSGTKKTTKKS